MQTTVQTAVVHSKFAPLGAMVSVVAVDFGSQAEPLTLDEQILEIDIQVEGMKERRCMLMFAKTGVIAHKYRAVQHMHRMMDLIKGRSERVRARMAAERGLPHG